MTALLTAERVRELLIYDPESGVFHWRVHMSKRVRAGSVAGSPGGVRGYLRISFDGKTHYAHRLAVLYMTGVAPDGEVDHRDGCPSNNRWANLRTADRSSNAQNLRRATARSSTGLLGASFDAERGQFIAQIQRRGKRKTLGRFDTAQEAHDAYLAAKREIHEGCTI